MVNADNRDFAGGLGHANATRGETRVEQMQFDVFQTVAPDEPTRGLLLAVFALRAGALQEKP